MAKKRTTVGQEIILGAQEALAWARGNTKAGRMHTFRDIDVAKLRRRLKLSQPEFAAKFGLSLDSVQNWEQRHRSPEGPARVLLSVIARNPRAVEQAVRAMRRRLSA
ncbi:MAG: transcriptional regulator [Acidobacteriia bacterium]|nr:transcriptional regulator [Terriglobia bacterium]